MLIWRLQDTVDYIIPPQIFHCAAAAVAAIAATHHQSNANHVMNEWTKNETVCITSKLGSKLEHELWLMRISERTVAARTKH